MHIDIDKLHDVLEGKRFGRGDGRTIAGLVQLAQYTDFHPYGKLVHFSANFTQAIENARVFKEHILDGLGMKEEASETYKDYMVFKNGCKVYFMSLGEGITRVQNRLSGLRVDNYVVDHFAEYLLSPAIETFIKTRLM
jgi:hypothetical protein